MRLAPQETRTYFVTTATAQRRPLFLTPATAELLQATLLDYRAQGRYQLHAFVIMPDHLHALITPAPDVSLEKAMQFIKGGFSFRLKSKIDVWTKSYNEVQISNPDRCGACIGYIEQNPVRNLLVADRLGYPYSSANRMDLDPVLPHLRD